MDFGLLLLILFIIAPLLEKLLKAGRPQQPPGQQQPGQRPQQRQPGQRPQAPQRPRPEPRPEAEEEAAAAMLPDDLWEILTGERRPQPQQAPPRETEFTYDEPTTRAEPAAPAPRRAELPPPAHSRAPRPLPDRARVPMRERRLPKVDTRRLPEVEVRRPGPTVRPRSAGPPPSAADDLVRRPTVHEAPVVVSLETPIEDSDTRRARFHERLAATDRPRTGFRPADNPWAFATLDEARRAIVMAEILGRPKGLE